MDTKPVCNSTGRRLTNDRGSVSFPCPKCGDETIHRSSQARKAVIPYTCKQCGFEGPT